MITFIPSLLQILDPTPYQEFGIMGILGLAIAILCALVWRLVVKQSEAFEKRDQVLMAFVSTHRAESGQALNHLGEVLDASMAKLVIAFDRQQRKLEEVILTGRVLEKVAGMRKRGMDLDETTVEQVVRSVIKERDPG